MVLVRRPENLFWDFGNCQLGANFGRMQIDYDFVRPYFGDIDPCKIDLNEMNNENLLLPNISTEFLGRYTSSTKPRRAKLGEWRMG